MTEEQTRRYEAALHRRQSAVAFALERFDRALEPKHLRVGIDGALSDQGALAKLCIAKGLFTLEEYEAAIVEAAEQEAESWVRRVKRTYNLPDHIDFG